MDLRHKLLPGRHKDKVILCVGNLVARKGQDMVIRALPSLRQTIPDVTYLIVGEGPYRVPLDKLTLELGVRDRVIFAGRILVEELPDIYAISDVFVMPSRNEECDVEGFGLVFLEASACAKPVVGGRSGGIPDAIEEGVTGLLVGPRDPEDIANALARLLSDGDLAADWVNKAGLGSVITSLGKLPIRCTAFCKTYHGKNHSVLPDAFCPSVNKILEEAQKLILTHFVYAS